MSAIERQLKNIKQDVEQREVSRELSSQHLAELSKSLTNLQAVKQAVADFDFQQASTSFILETVLAGAVTTGASDVHFEPQKEAIRVRYRLDGLLSDVSDNFPLSAYKLIASRVKLLSGLKINITDKAQDGQFDMVVGSKSIEFRVSVVPSDFGESLVIRVLDPDAINIPLTDLGLRDDDLEIVLEEIKAPNGMILNTGPTGSGKTTTLYSFLKKRQSPDSKMITIEDPIEYNIKGIEQTQVNSESDYTFANGLRSLMRQDPDVILVGEIRDSDTAAAAIQAALTGHLVFSTIHANNAAGAIPRLLDLGVKPVSVGPALNLIMAQRLVRRLCDHCKKPIEMDETLREKVDKFLAGLPERVKRENYKEGVIYQSVGCEICNQLGFKGRVGIFELLKTGKDIEDLIEKGVSESDLYNFAVGKDMVTIQQDGVLKVLLGITTFSEIEKATGSLSLSS
ncbi:MAG: GspE/PulE family protein [Patescibacteria group bacterium]